MFKKLAVISAASAMVLASTAAQAGTASALSLRNAASSEPRTATAAQKQSKLLPGGPLFGILGLIGVVALLEVTGVINIFGDDEADSN